MLGSCGANRVTATFTHSLPDLRLPMRHARFRLGSTVSADCESAERRERCETPCNAHTHARGVGECDSKGKVKRPMQKTGNTFKFKIHVFNVKRIFFTRKRVSRGRDPPGRDPLKPRSTPQPARPAWRTRRGPDHAVDAERVRRTGGPVPNSVSAPVSAGRLRLGLAAGLGANGNAPYGGQPAHEPQPHAPTATRLTDEANRRAAARDRRRETRPSRPQPHRQGRKDVRSTLGEVTLMNGTTPPAAPRRRTPPVTRRKTDGIVLTRG